MSLLAANLAIALALTGMQSAGRRVSREVALWNEMRPALVTIEGRGKPTGVAALIDDKGYFVAHSSSISGDQATGITSAGKELSFSVVCRDKASMLVLLKTDSWDEDAARPFHAPTEEDTASAQLIAVLPTGPLRMAFGLRHKLGVLDPSRRVVPVTEIRFEATPQLVGGALIFSETGALIGSLNATLGSQYGGQRGQAGAGGFGGSVGNRGLSGAQQSQGRDGNSQIFNPGPAPMTVGYTISPEFVRHVIDDFLSPSHSVEFAVLGVYCKDAIGGGAEIESVTVGSPADKAGLHPGDVLLNIASTLIQDQLAFAYVMLQQKPGKRIPVVVQRGPAKLLIDIVPAKAAD